MADLRSTFIYLICYFSVSCSPLSCGGYPRNNKSENGNTGSHSNGAVLSIDWDFLFSDGTFLGTTFDDGLTISSTNNQQKLDPTWTPHWDNILAYWTFENSWNDTKGSNHFSPNGDATFNTNAKTGNYAAYFDGSGDNIVATLVELNDFPISDDFTATMWIRRDRDHDIPGISKPWEFWCDGGGYIANLWQNDDFDTWSGLDRFYQYDGGTPSGPGQQPGIRSFWSSYPYHNLTTVTDRYHHYALQREGTKIKFYINGTLVGTADTFGDNEKCDWFRMGDNLRGEIDDVAFWNVALSESEIKIIYDRLSAAQSGIYISPVLENPEKTGGSWDLLSLVSHLPLLKELPDNNQSEAESSYQDLSTETLMQGNAALWHLNETVDNPSGPDFFDSSGNENHGILESGSGDNIGRNGIFNKAYYGLSKTYTERIEIAPDPSLDLGNYMTFAAWVQPSELSKEHTIYSNRWATSAGGWAIQVGALDGNAHAVGVESPGHRNALSGENVIKRNEWNHIVYTVDGTGSGAQKVFVNGVEIFLVTNDAIAFSDAIPAPVRTIGADGTVASQDFIGAIDEVALWNRPLTDAEVRLLYRRGINRSMIQVRNCVTADCSDQDATPSKGWAGLTGTVSSYYTELDSTSLGSLTLGLSGMVQPYIQLRTFLENHDSALLCENFTKTCLPKIHKLRLSPQGFSQDFEIK